MTRRATRAAAFDAAAIIVFAAAGRRSHGADDDLIVGTLTVAAPFLMALAVGWVALRVWRRPTDVGTGLAIWPIVIVVGMLLRATVFDRGTAASFVVVASVATGLLLVGWRGAWRLRSCS